MCFQARTDIYRNRQEKQHNRRCKAHYSEETPLSLCMSVSLFWCKLIYVFPLITFEILFLLPLETVLPLQLRPTSCSRYSFKPQIVQIVFVWICFVNRFSFFFTHWETLIKLIFYLSSSLWSSGEVVLCYSQIRLPEYDVTQFEEEKMLKTILMDFIMSAFMETVWTENEVLKQK